MTNTILEVETNQAYTDESWAEFCAEGFIELDAPGDGSVYIEVSSENLPSVKKALNRADWCESYCEATEWWQSHH